MERQKFNQSNRLINPDWERPEIWQMIENHRKQAAAAGFYESFYASMRRSVTSLIGHISINQIAGAEDIAESRAPIIVITEYDELLEELSINLAKLDIHNGWMLGLNGESKVNLSIVPCANIDKQGNIILSEHFNYDQLELANNWQNDYKNKNFNITNVFRRYSQNQIPKFKQ